jgi:hypothetical protein
LLNPTAPNPYYDLSVVLADADRHHAALGVLDRMCDYASFDDIWLRVLEAECRSCYLPLCVQVAEKDFGKAWSWAEKFKSEIERTTDIPIELREDESLGSTSVAYAFFIDRLLAPAWPVGACT